MSEAAWPTALRLPRRRRARAALAFAVVPAAAVALGIALWWPASHEAAAAAPSDPATLQQDELTRTTGVRVVRVVVTGGGGLIDVRYQVLDAEKAASIHDAGRPPSVVDERTGAVLDRQWMGHDASQHATRPGRTEYMLLLNPGGFVQAGASVTVRLGDGDLSHVLVR